MVSGKIRLIKHCRNFNSQKESAFRSSMNFNNNPFPIIFLQVITLFFGFSPVATQAAHSINCLECHKKYVYNELKNSFVHQPFLQKNCIICHSPDWVDNAAASDGKALFPIKTKKLGSGHNPARIHLFSIPKDLEPNILFVEANYGTNKTFRTKLRVPPFDSIKTLSSDATPPVISNIHVTEIQRNDMVTARIRWETDKLASSSFYYGIGEPDKHTSSSSCYMSKHFIDLTTLEPDETYNFVVKVEDIYGNSRKSTPYSFSTDKSFKVKETKQTTHSQVPMALNSEIFRSEDNYLIRLNATQPVSIEISTYDMPNFPLLKEITNRAPANHPPLKNIYETNVLTCETCHLAPNDRFSHLVNFRAKLGSNIPSQYPRLPDGQISCITCHLQHGSNTQFHLRESSDRTLCIGCHKRSFKKK